MCAHYIRSGEQCWPLTYDTPATPAASWFLKRAKASAVSGPATLLFPFPGMRSPKGFTRLVFPPFRSQTKCRHSRRAFPGNLI